MKFQNISIHGSKVMLCTRKRDKQMNKQMNEWTSQKQYAHQLFQSWGHKNFIIAYVYLHTFLIYISNESRASCGRSYNYRITVDMGHNTCQRKPEQKSIILYTSLYHNKISCKISDESMSWGYKILLGCRITARVHAMGITS